MSAERARRRQADVRLTPERSRWWQLAVQSVLGAAIGSGSGCAAGLLIGWLLGVGLSIWGMVSVPILGALGLLLGVIGGVAYPWMRRAYEAA